MNSDAVSVFDLSPSEKFQFVEVLWDDLAATPMAIPMPDWHAEELAQRKARLMANPGTGLDWEAVRQAVRRYHNA